MILGGDGRVVISLPRVKTHSACSTAASSGGPQSAEDFDNCDGKLADLALARLEIAAALYHNHSHSQPFFLGLGMMSPHIPYHFPPEYADLYPAPEDLPLAKFQVLHKSQPTVAWYDQGDTYTSPAGMATYSDVAQSGGLWCALPLVSVLCMKCRTPWYRWKTQTCLF